MLKACEAKSFSGTWLTYRTTDGYCCTCKVATQYVPYGLWSHDLFRPSYYVRSHLISYTNVVDGETGEGGGSSFVKFFIPMHVQYIYFYPLAVQPVRCMKEKPWTIMLPTLIDLAGYANPSFTRCL